MKKAILIAVSLLLIGISFTSCHKVEDIEQLPSATEYLTGKTWNGEYVDMFRNGKKTGSESIESAQLEFSTDSNFFEFNNNDIQNSGSWELIEGTPVIIKIHLTSTTNSMLATHNRTIELEVRELNTNSFSFSTLKPDSEGHLIQYIYHFK